MDADLALAIARAYKLNLRTFELIQAMKGLLPAKIPGLRNNKELYQCYQRFGKELWKAADEYAAENISLPGEGQSYARSRKPRPRANALHLVASFVSFKGNTIKQLADIGSLIAEWFIEDMAYFVTRDYEKNKDDPENAEYEALWGNVPEPEEMHTMTGYDEAFLRKLNQRLSEA
jgi:hypothetical protein